MEVKIIEIVSEILKVESSLINLETGISDIEQWDSIRQIQIIIALEEEFEVRFSADDLVEANSVSKLISSISAAT